MSSIDNNNSLNSILDKLGINKPKDLADFDKDYMLQQVTDNL